MRAFFLFLSFTILSCKSNKNESIGDICFSEEEFSELKETSIENLIKSKDLQGQKVKVPGYFYLEFENNALYPSKPSTSSGAIWLKVSSDLSKQVQELQKFNGKKVV